MALQEFLVEGRNGGKCVMYKILNEQVPQFEQYASLSGVATEKHGKGREASIIYVCSTTPQDLGPLKSFVREGLVLKQTKKTAA